MDPLSKHILICFLIILSGLLFQLFVRIHEKRQRERHRRELMRRYNDYWMTAQVDRTINLIRDIQGRPHAQSETHNWVREGF